MRVLFSISDLGLGGGGERVVVTLANEFALLGHSVCIVHFGESTAYLPSSSVAIFGVSGRSSQKVLRKAERLLRYVRTLRAFNPDVVVAFGYSSAPYAALASLGHGCALISSARSDPESEPRSWLARLARNLAYGTSDHLVCQTRQAAEYFEGVTATSVILNPVRADLPETWLGPRRHVVVNFCRLEPQKNLVMLIDAFSRFSITHPDYTLEIYGEGSLQNELVATAEELGVGKKVSIRPFSVRVHEEVRDVAVFASSSDHEGLSNSMLEALALGIPVIATDCPIGGARTAIGHLVNGILVPVGDAAAMADALTMLCESPELAAKLSAGGAALRADLAAEVIAGSWLSVVERVRRSKRPHSRGRRLAASLTSTRAYRHLRLPSDARA